MKPWIRLVCVGILIILAVAPSTARELHWDSMEVRARLDADGLLHIQERQVMVFTGDWNGGERSFHLRPGQKIHLQSLRRVAGTGEVDLHEGDLSAVDEFAWSDGDVLRWRSRLPDDPWFDETVLTYVLDYTLSGTLKRLEGKTFRIAPDFAFPNREGVIETFDLTFEIDPVWTQLDSTPLRLQRESLAPGRSVVVTTDLGYSGPDWPAAVPKPTPIAFLGLFFLSSLGAIVHFVRSLHRHEAAQGRYEPLSLPADLDAEWLEEHLFRFAPEEAGALWDRKIGPPEVAAVIARLVAEGKLKSRTGAKGRAFGPPVLHLEKAALGSELRGYDRLLVNKLFFNGRSRTDTKSIREHYRKTSEGFNPAQVIRSALERQLDAKLKRETRSSTEAPPANPWRTVGIALPAVALVVAAGILRPQTNVFLPILALLPGILFYGIAYYQAYRWRQRIDWEQGASARFLVPLALTFLAAVTAALFAYFFAPTPAGLLANLGLALFPVAFASSVTNGARTRDSHGVVQERKILATARQWLQAELEKERPRLRDEWFPYLLALGLEKDVDHWFKAYGGATSSTSVATASLSSSSSSFGGGGGGSRWTGGGGAFGGAGASASWASAAQGIASPVSPPSSSGGSSGGGGGGSSGGGGGGGW